MAKKLSLVLLGFVSGCALAATESHYEVAPASCPATKSAPAAQPAAQQGAVKHITSTQELDALRKSGEFMAVKVGTDSCQPCQIMKPLLAQVAAQHPDVLFVEFNVTNNDAMQAETKRRYDVDAWPSLVLFDKQGNQVPPTEKGGFTNAAEIDGIIKVLKGEMKWMNVPEGAPASQPAAHAPAAPAARPAPAQQAPARPMPQQSASRPAPVAQQAPAARPAPAPTQNTSSQAPLAAHPAAAQQAAAAPDIAQQPMQVKQPKNYRTVQRIRSAQ